MTQNGILVLNAAVDLLLILKNGRGSGTSGTLKHKNKIDRDFDAIQIISDKLPRRRGAYDSTVIDS